MTEVITEQYTRRRMLQTVRWLWSSREGGKLFRDKGMRELGDDGWYSTTSRVAFMIVPRVGCPQNTPSLMID